MEKLLFVILLQVAFGATKTVPLTQGWTLRNASTVISNINLPSGVFTELERNGYTDSVLFSRNDIDLRWIGDVDWTYDTTFPSKLRGSRENFLKWDESL